MANALGHAVRLDADYLNAWGKIQSLSDQVYVPAADRDAAALNLLRLDPLGRHTHPQLETLADLRKLWDGVAATQALQPPHREKVYPLAAAQAEADQATARMSAAEKLQARMAHESSFEYSLRSRGAGSPAQVLARHQIIQAIGQLIDSTRQ